MAGETNERDIVDALEENWRAEVQSARMYRELAAAEKDNKRRSVLLRMAEAEDRHGARWAKKLREHGIEPATVDSWRERLDRWWNRQAGTDIVEEVGREAHGLLIAQAKRKVFA